MYLPRHLAEWLCGDHADLPRILSYDQGQVAQAALEFSVLPNLPDVESKQICQDLAADIIEYTTRDLRSPEGGFYSAEDADSGESLENPDKHIGEYCFTSVLPAPC